MEPRMNSRQRLAEYVKLFNDVDSKRSQFMSDVVKKVLHTIDLPLAETIETEKNIDLIMEKIAFLDILAEELMNAITENGELSGN